MSKVALSAQATWRQPGSMGRFQVASDGLSI